MFNMQNLVSTLLSNNPQVTNNPQTKGYIDVIQSGDSAKGEQIARNICNSMGKTPEQVYAEATKFFGIR